ncbi:hypothetical protein [Stieleria mannarensis]|uniref:hypothetical protein n=1 Tax=Stieleria mannarensis TaxID=2755585 RepID=UPI0016008284|nr:hypothetical protein [Rhodopirellula sp. JC639]
MALYLVTLALTIGIELAIVAVARRIVPKLRESPILMSCVCINSVTHPLATLSHFGLSLPLLPVELAVIAVESIGYRSVGGIAVKRSMGLALATNLASMIVGVLAF